MSQVLVPLFSAILGAVVVIIGWVVSSRRAARSDARARFAEYLKIQITDLYGPLVFLAEINESLWERSERIRAAYHEYFSTRTDERFSQEMTEVIDKMNLYGERILANNQEIIPLLKAHWGLLDVDDVEPIRQYLSDVFVQDLESGRAGPTLPAAFYMPNLLKSSLGPKLILRAGFAGNLRKKLLSKQVALQGLTETTTRLTRKDPAGIEHRIEHDVSSG